MNRGSRMVRWALGPTLVVLSACGGKPGGPQLAELEVFAIDGAGHVSDRHCTEMPVLRGGRARDEIDVAGEFSLIVDATPQWVTLSFFEVENAEKLDRELLVEELREGYSEELDVTTTADRRFLVHLNSRCQ